jgi:hypothetical protein
MLIVGLVLERGCHGGSRLGSRVWVRAKMAPKTRALIRDSCCTEDAFPATDSHFFATVSKEGRVADFSRVHIQHTAPPKVRPALEECRIYTGVKLSVVAAVLGPPYLAATG